MDPLPQKCSPLPLLLSGSSKYLSVFFCARCTVLTSILTLNLSASSVALYLILAVPMHKCFRKQSCMSYSFPVAILNLLAFFRSVNAMKNLGNRALKLILLNILVHIVR